MLCAGPIEAGVSVVLDQPAMMFPTLIMNRSARSFVARLLEYEVLRERMDGSQDVEHQTGIQVVVSYSIDNIYYTIFT